jgi:hypothetical protein
MIVVLIAGQKRADTHLVSRVMIVGLLYLPARFPELLVKENVRSRTVGVLITSGLA